MDVMDGWIHVMDNGWMMMHAWVGGWCWMHDDDDDDGQ